MPPPDEEDITPISRWFNESNSNNLNNKFEYDSTDTTETKGVSVMWKRLGVTADIKKTHLIKPTDHVYKKIIHNIDGIIEPGKFVAILGASGSGKSTLMTVLANRNPGGLLVNGDIRIGGKQIGQFTRQMSGFVYQDDLFIPHLTVKEHLHFSARLRLSRTASREHINELVMTVLTEVGLLKCANNRIGSTALRNQKVTLSGGERKRLSVATELLTNPPLLFCDEPTTGLDSFTALKLMSVMRGLSMEKEKTIICSIHQPSDKIFLLFDQIILLSAGKVAFMGNIKDAISFFESQGYPYASDQNPAEYLIKSVAAVPGKEAKRTEELNLIYKKFVESDYGRNITRQIEKEIKKHERLESFSYDKKIYKPPSFLYKLFVITYRSILGIIRNPSVQRIRIIQKSCIGLLMGLSMQGSVVDTQHGIQALTGVIFVMTAQNFFPAIYAVMNHVPSQLPVFYREYGNGMNTPLIFLLSNIFSLFPGLLIDPIIFTSIVYWLASLRPTLIAFVLTCFISTVVLHTSSAFGMFLSVVFKNPTVALTLSAPLETCLSILSGFYIKLSTIPWILAWMRYVSWFTYACESLLIVQIQQVPYIECDPDPSLPCLSNGTEVLQRYNYHENHLWPNIIIMLTIYIMFYVVSYFSLLKRTQSRTI